MISKKIFNLSFYLSYDSPIGFYWEGELEVNELPVDIHSIEPFFTQEIYINNDTSPELGLLTLNFDHPFFADYYIYRAEVTDRSNNIAFDDNSFGGSVFVTRFNDSKANFQTTYQMPLRVEKYLQDGWNQIKPWYFVENSNQNTHYMYFRLQLLHR